MSLEERYGNIETYSLKLRAAIDKLVQGGYLLPQDAETALTENISAVKKNSLLLAAK